MLPRNPRAVCRGAEKAGILVAIWEAYALLDIAGGVKPARTAAPARAVVPLYGEFHPISLASDKEEQRDR